jgi:hypothetical protein
MVKWILIGSLGILAIIIISGCVGGQTEIKSFSDCETVPIGSCDQIIGNEFNNRDACYVIFAEKNKDVTICEKAVNDRCPDIIGDNYKNDCYWRVAKAVGDSEICKKMEQDDLNRDIIDSINKCVAEVNKDTTPCQEIDDTTYRSACIIVVARETKNNSICEEIDSDFWKKACREEVAKY